MEIDTEKQEKIICPMCRKGTLQEGFSNYYPLFLRCEITVLDVPSLICDECGDTLRHREANHRVRAFVEKIAQRPNTKTVTVTYNEITDNDLL